jgi:sortase (surface protein transpeptidase)
VRPAAATAVLGLALAVGAPAAWSLTRPAATAGAPVTEILGTPSASPSAAAPTDPGILRSVPTRPAAPQAPEVRPAPARLVVPALGVDAGIDAVGVEADGQMTVPAEVDRVGWYRFGPAPGSAGSAVIAGHVDSRTQGLGAMAPLRGAAVGDEVLVTDTAGTTTRWRVVSREVIEKQRLPLDRLFTRDGPPRLTLITCGGPFLPDLGSYRDNVVVVAEAVS